MDGHSRFIAHVLAIVGALAAGGCNKPEPGPDRVAAPAAQPKPDPVQCLDLPGGVRQGFALSPDRKRLAFVETLPGLWSRGSRFHLVQLDVERGTVATLTREPLRFSDGPRYAGDQLVLAMSRQVPGERNLFAIGPDGALRMLSDPAAFVVGFGVGGSPPRVVYSRLVPETGGKMSIQSVSLDGSGSSQVVKEGSLLAVLPDARAVVRNPAGAVQILGGDASRTIAQKADAVRHVAGNWLVVQGKQADGEVVQTLISASDDAFKLTLDKGDVALAAGETVFVKRPTGSRTTLLELIGSRLEPRLELNGPTVAAAWRLDETRTLVAVVHDTNGDAEPAGGEDETDFCVIHGKGPLEIATRSLPRAKLAGIDKLKSAAQQLLGPTAGMRFVDEGSVLVVELASLTADEAELRTLVRKAGAELSSAVQPELEGVLLRAPNGREGLYARFDGNQKRLVFTATHGVRLADPADYAVEVKRKHVAQVELLDLIGVQCTGEVRNVGTAPIPAVSVSCRAAHEERTILAKRVEATQSVELGDLAPGQVRKFEVKIGGRALKGLGSFSLDIESTVLSAGVAMADFDVLTNEDQADFTTVLAAVAKEFEGLAPSGSILRGSAALRPVLHGSVQLVSSRPLDKNDRARLAALLRAKAKAHVERFHKETETPWFAVRTPTEAWRFDGKQLVSSEQR